MRKLQFPKSLRLLKPSEFQRVLDARHIVSDRFLRLGGVANGLAHPRLGLTVSRKVGNAVARNRWKRVLREAFRLTQHELSPLDLVCIPRGDSCPGLRQLMVTLPSLADRLDKRLLRDSMSGTGDVGSPSKPVP